MKNHQSHQKILGSIAIASYLFSSLFLTSIAVGAPQRLIVKFYCGQSFDASSNKILPTTLIATSARSEPVALIQWKSTAFSQYTPQNRCAIVSPKLQRAWSNQQLNYLMAGTSARTGQGLICGSSKKSKCGDSNMLFTLRTKSEAREIIDRIKGIQWGKSNNPIPQSTGDEHVELQKIVKQLSNK
jgi:Circadian oscillating protein COP23